ncbi:MAG: DUF2339 domain-containing protein [Verrucomicrobia bacterium]|nr:DUF2339 domain-containing protein [Verrucomicrobiota bacterium]
MQCPRCQADISDSFCKNCGLDLALWKEVEQLRTELNILKADLSAFTTSTKTSVSAPLQEGPPPVPAHLIGNPPLATHETGAEERRNDTLFAERNVGRRWFLVVGSLTLVIGLGFFLKYAFDEQWIGPAVQITIGFIAGAVSLLLAHLCRQRRWMGLDIGMAAVGLGSLYLTSYAGFEIHHLLPLSLSLVLILLVTLFGGTLASFWGSQTLAILSFTAGFLAPVLFDSEHVDHWFFLPYLVILTLAGQIVAYAKGWRQLYASSALLTWLSFALWIEAGYRQPWFLEAFVFIQFLFAAYSLMPFLRRIFRAELGSIQGFLLAVLNGLLCCQYSGMLLRYEKHPLAFVSLIYAATTLLIGISSVRKSRTISSWLVTQALIFLLVFWAQILVASWLTLFWSAQLIALYIAAARGEDKNLLVATFIIAVTVVCNYFASVQAFEYTYLFSHDLLSRWVSGLSLISSLFVIAWMDQTAPIHHTFFRQLIEILALISLFIFANLELHRFTQQYIRLAGAAGMSVLWTLYSTGLMLIGVSFRRKAYRMGAIIILFITVLKVLAYDTAQVSTPYRILSCLILGAILIAVSFVYYRFDDRLAGK